MDFRSIFLDYFKKQIEAKLPIDIKEIKEIAKGYEITENILIKKFL